MYWIWKIYIMKQFREIIYTKFREILRHFAKFREIKCNEISRNFAKFREIKITFAVISYFAQKKILFRDHPKLK
jgi:hypothetical protein